jgi:hypothetical protein
MSGCPLHASPFKSEIVKTRMDTKFQGALEAGDLDAIRRCPKTDLHNHGWAGAAPKDVQAILRKPIAFDGGDACLGR